MSRLFITDLDGTLLNESTLVSHRSACLINEAVAGGALFSVATARTPATVEVLLKEIELRLPAIVMTGAAMWDSRARRYINPCLIPAESSRSAVETFRECGLEPFMYCIDGEFLKVYHHGSLTPEEKYFVDARTGLRLKQFILDATPGRVKDASDVILIFGMGEREMLQRIAGRLADAGDYSISFYEDNASTQYYIEVFAPGVSKASAVRKLAEMTGADEITVYGDNLNDISMMQAATDAVAVANAKAEVIEAASRVIGSCNDDAVALDVMNHNLPK